MTAKHTSAVEKLHTHDAAADQAELSEPSADEPAREIGGRKSGLEPTRYGDWEKNGRCIDF